MLGGSAARLFAVCRPLQLRTWRRMFGRSQMCRRRFSTAAAACVEEKDMQPTQKELMNRDRFFQEKEVKDRGSFLRLVEGYSRHDRVRRGQIEFIYAALKHMSDYGVEGDVEVYKRLMDVFPKGKMVPRSLIQAEFFHFGRHQECGVFLLDRMEHEGIVPDSEMKEIVLAVFGVSSVVYKKLARMLYWMPKLKNINPFPLPDPLPTDPRELAHLALKKMCRDKRTAIHEWDTALLPDVSDRTWVVSGQSPTQKVLLSEHREEEEGALWVEGPTLVWLRKVSMTYFALKAQPKFYTPCKEDEDDLSHISLHMFGEPRHAELILAPQSMHEQEEGTVLALCCTGSSSKDSLLSWVRLLQMDNPCLASLPVLFKVRTSPASLVAVNNAASDTETLADALREERKADYHEEEKT